MLTPADSPPDRDAAGSGGSAGEAIFETLLADIVGGTYPPGVRLPAERDLARRLGASRPTLREALRRLADWRLVESRRGSGVVVRDRHDWSIEVLPAYLRHGLAADAATGGEVSPAVLIRDLLSLRRSLLIEVVRLIGDRVDDRAVARAREAMHAAWASRDDPARFAAEDFQVMRGLVEEAGFLPAVWLLNRLSGVYLELARLLGNAVRPAEDYVEVHEAFLEPLARGHADEAAERLARYLEEHDRDLCERVGGAP